MLRDGAVRVGTMAAFFAVGTVIALTIFLPLYGQLALGLSVSGSALTIIALQGAATVTSIVGGRLIARIAPLQARAARRAGGVDRGARAARDRADRLLAGSRARPDRGRGFGLGPMFPFTIVVVQNAVPLHQLGIATGTMNFFRALGGTFIVTGFGAIVLAGAPTVRGMSAGAVLAGAEAAEAFRWVFAAAVLCLVIALAAVLALEERPLAGIRSGNQ